MGLGNRSNGVAEEMFLRPADPDKNRTACPTSQISFDDHATYLVKVFVREEPCPHKSAMCHSIGYRLQKTAPVFGPAGPTKGGNTTNVDDTAQGAVFGGGPTVTPYGWTALSPSDRSSWFISHVFTSKSNRWSFRIKNLKVIASNTAPTWWTSP